MNDLHNIENAIAQALRFDSEWDAFLDRIGGPEVLLLVIDEARKYRLMQSAKECTCSKN